MQKNLPHLIFNSAEVYSMEHDYAKSHGGSSFMLMERAGEAVFRKILEIKPDVKTVFIFAGSGNNGGDGYIVARLLLERGIDVSLFATSPARANSEAETAYKRYLAAGGRVYTSLPSESANADIVVDALLGTGLKSDIRAPYDRFIEFINKLNAIKISIDVPSGLNADTGVVSSDCVIADYTLCMLALKTGLFTADAVDYTGEVSYESLSFDTLPYYKKLSADEGGPYLPCLNRYYENIIEDLPLRLKSANKGDCGKILIIAGAFGMGGASILCGIGALRGGGGLIKIATDARNFSAINAYAPELMTVDFDNASELGKALSWADVVAIGPGLTQNERATYLFDMVTKFDKCVVYDADALNLMAATKNFNFLQKKILTPHPGEAARLLNTTVEKIHTDRFDACYRLWQKYGGVVLLKGAGTIVCDGVHLTLINEGSPAMASGGMGDLLTGLIASLLAQGASLNTAAVVGCCVHGRAGLMCGSDNGVIGTKAGDLALYIRRLVNGF